MKVYVPYGKLFSLVGPAGVFKTREEAEKAGRDLDEYKIAEYELAD